jgi:hypothetical protein
VKIQIIRRILDSVLRYRALCCFFSLALMNAHGSEVALGAANTQAESSPRAAPTGASEGEAAIPEAPSKARRQSNAHRFWDRENLYLFGGIAAMRTLDYTSTRNMQRRGREEILLPDDVVNSRPGFVALEAAGAATSIGISYLLHSTGHHKLERWLSIGHISVAGFGAARNYALKSHHVNK